jgi:pyruvate/2-oxoglutarate dehydrogenase complex dihydrolipoamide dehydrogenase (E3) component
VPVRPAWSPAYIAAAVKAKVTLVEAHKMGGDCLNYGCVPSKALIKTATLVRQMRHSADYGVAQGRVRRWTSRR